MTNPQSLSVRALPRQIRSAGAVTLAAPLAPGATIDVQWRLGVMQTGNFRFYIKVEGLP